MGVGAQRILERLCAREAEMVTLAESFVRGRVALDARAIPAAALPAHELAELSFVVRSVAAPAGGRHLYARPRDRARCAPRQLLLGHLDTVWPLGTVDGCHVERVGDRLYGPGIFDMKVALVQLVFALRALRELRLEPAETPVIFVNRDEEPGSRDSHRYIRLLAQKAARVLVLEPAYGPSGKLKTPRKGIGRFTVVAHGCAAHAGPGRSGG